MLGHTRGTHVACPTVAIIQHNLVVATTRCVFRDNVSMPKAPCETKVCPVCKVEKHRSEYYKKCDTISHKCKPCSLADSKARAHNYLGAYREYQNDWRRSKYKEDPAYRERIAKQKKTIYDKRKEELNAKRRERWANDPLTPDRKYYRRKDVKDKTPPWVDLDEVLEIYSKCPPGHHVDHIVPLRGVIDARPVSGLHVPWNLQYLPASENLKKKNKITEMSLQAQPQSRCGRHCSAPAAHPSEHRWN